MVPLRFPIFGTACSLTAYGLSLYTVVPYGSSSTVNCEGWFFYKLIQIAFLLPTPLYTHMATYYRTFCSYYRTLHILTDCVHCIHLKVSVNPKIQKPLISEHDFTQTTDPFNFYYEHAIIHDN